MPIYEYRCAVCGHELEALQKFSDAPLDGLSVVPQAEAEEAVVRGRLPVQRHRAGTRPTSATAARSPRRRTSRRRRRHRRQWRKRSATNGEARRPRAEMRRPPKSQHEPAPTTESQALRHPRRRRKSDVLSVDCVACTSMKRYLIAGLLVWVPLGITIWVLHFLLTSLDQMLRRAAGERAAAHAVRLRHSRASASCVAFLILLAHRRRRRQLLRRSG